MPVDARHIAFSIVVEPTDLMIRIRRALRHTKFRDAANYRPARVDHLPPASYPWPSISLPGYLR